MKAGYLYAPGSGISADAVAADSAGNVVFTSPGNDVWVLAGHSGTFYGQAMTAGQDYLIAGTGEEGFSGDGGPATAAELDRPQGVAVDANGNVLISDTDNQEVRVVAATTGVFYGQAMTAGNIYTIAGDHSAGFGGDGGPANAAELAYPDGVALDSAGNVVVSDGGNGRIRVVAATTGTFYDQAMTAGDIYTIAGGGTGFGGDGGPATAAALDDPGQVAAVTGGGLYIADTDNQRIRMVTG
jgi:sugar lactone lactonase YvrE